MKGDSPEEAITEFLGLPALEEEKGDWSVLRLFLEDTVAHHILESGASKD